MKKIPPTALALLLLLLASPLACHIFGEDVIEPTMDPALETLIAQATHITEMEDTATPAAEATRPATPTPAPSTLAHGPLPHVVATITLGDPPKACTGRTLAVDERSGIVYTAGTRDDRACLSVIEPATDEIQAPRDLPFPPRTTPHDLLWDGQTLYAVGQAPDDELIIADVDRGQVVTRGSLPGALQTITLRDGWGYGLAGDTLSLIPLQQEAEWPAPIRDVAAFDLATDGRIAVVGGAGRMRVRVYAGPGGPLLAERDLEAGEPGGSVAFAGQVDRLFVTRQVDGTAAGEVRSFLDILDAKTLDPIRSIETWVTMLTIDPGGERIYARAGGDQFVGFDARSGDPLGTFFTIPPSEGFGVYDPREKLTIDPPSGRVTTTYTDFDGETWIAGFDPSSGEGVADVRVPGGRCALDGVRGRLYCSGTSFLLALDATTLQPVWRLSLSRSPVSAAVAPDTRTLFVGDAGGDVHALDLQTHAETRVLTGVGGYVDVDPVHGWLYTGDEFAAGVAVYDLGTIERRGLIAQPGRPNASPADARVYILEEDVYVGDGETATVIKGRTTRNAGCNGCGFPTGVVVDPTSGITLTTTYGVWVGKAGPTGQATVDPLTGHAFVARTSGGYRVVNTLAAYADLTLERLLAWRDGLYGQPLFNPVSGHLYLVSGSRLLVLDGGTLDPVGWLQPADTEMIPAAVDNRSGRLYLLAGPRILVLDAAGSPFETPPSQPVRRLPGSPEGIVPLENGTLFVRASSRDDYVSRLYRSTDGGSTWEEIHGGLPGAPNDLIAAPDGTLYAAAMPTAWRPEVGEGSWGEGVYRSTDGGDSWSLLSRGLSHLMVSRLQAGLDGTPVALAAGMWPDQQNWRVPTLWRLAGDDRWSQIDVAGAGPYLALDGSLPYTYTQAVQATWHALGGRDVLYRPWGDELQVSTDGGATWARLGLGPADYGTQVISAAGDPPALYWLTWDAVYRSTDEGTRWGRLEHPALVESGPTAIAVTAWGGEETVFVGTEKGQLLVLPLSETDWR